MPYSGNKLVPGLDAEASPVRTDYTVNSDTSATADLRRITWSQALGLVQAADISDAAAGIAAWLVTPSSANLATALTDESGSGSVLFGTITGIASGEVLKWNGTTWINNTLAEANISAVGHGHVINDVTDWGTNVAAFLATPSSANLAAALTDESGSGSTLFAAITGIASGELIKWNGSNWVNNTLAEAGISAVGHTHAASDITSGTLADARISESSVTQHQSALTITESQISDLTHYTHPNHTGDVTSVADGATTIADEAVTYAKMQHVAAASRLLGRGSAAGAGDVEELTVGTGLQISGTVVSSTVTGTLWTDGGAITYLTSTTDDLAVGGTDSTSPLFMDVSAGKLSITCPVDAASNQVGVLTGNNRVVPAAGDEAYISFQLDNDLGASAEFARITWETNTTTSTAKDGELRLGVMVGDTLTDIVTLDETNGLNVQFDSGLATAHFTGGGGNGGTLKLRNTTTTGYGGFNVYDNSDVLAFSFQYGNPSAALFADECFFASRKATTEMVFFQGGVAAGNERMRFDASSNIIFSGNVQIDDSAGDHQYTIGVADIAANRTASLPLLTGNDTFLFEAHTATLTNKTIDGNNNTLTVLAASQLSGAVPIANGGSGQTTQQAAIDALTNVSAATNEHVLTKDTASGNAIFKAAGAADNLGNHTATQDLDMDGFNVADAGVMFMREQAAADADVGGQGQWWVKTATPNEPWFTDDAGTDFHLAHLSNTLGDFAATTSAQLAGVISDETGSGALVFGTSPSLTTPNIGVATGTSLALTANTNQITLDSDGANSGIINSSGLTADRTLSFPDASGTIVLSTNTVTLTNKTVNLTSNTLTGTKAQFNTALSDGSFAFDGGAHHDGFSDFVANEHIDHTSVTVTLSGDTNEITVAEGAQDISASRTFNIGIADDPIIPGTAKVRVPVGTTAQRPGVPADGDLRVNTDTGNYEGYRSAAWRDLEAGAGDNLGDHTATQALAMAGFDINNVGSITATDINLTANTNQIVLDSDAVNTMTLNASGMTGARSISTPDASGTMVLHSNTQTLTNKTINTASNTITVVEADISDLQSYLLNVVEDTTPQLGGDLDLNGNNLTYAGNASIDLTGAATRTLTIQNSTSSQQTDVTIDGITSTKALKLLDSAQDHDIEISVNTNFTSNRTFTWDIGDSDRSFQWYASAADKFVGRGGSGGSWQECSIDSTLAFTGSTLGVVSASTTVSGAVELATVAETDTGTDATRAVTPDGLNGSIHGSKYITVYAVEHSTTLTTGDGKAYFRVPDQFDSMNLVYVEAGVGATKPVGSTITIQIARLRAASAGAASRTQADMLSTTLTIDAGEWDSKDAATDAVINASNDDVQEGDILRIDIDQVGSSTAGDGLYLTFGFQKP